MKVFFFSNSGAMAVCFLLLSFGYFCLPLPLFFDNFFFQKKGEQEWRVDKETDTQRERGRDESRRF